MWCRRRVRSAKVIATGVSPGPARAWCGSTAPPKPTGTATVPTSAPCASGWTDGNRHTVPPVPRPPSRAPRWPRSARWPCRCPSRRWGGAGLDHRGQCSLDGGEDGPGDPALPMPGHTTASGMRTSRLLIWAPIEVMCDDTARGIEQALRHVPLEAAAEGAGGRGREAAVSQ